MAYEQAKTKKLAPVCQIMTLPSSKSTKPPLCPNCLTKGREVLTSFAEIPEAYKKQFQKNGMMSAIALDCPDCVKEEKQKEREDKERHQKYLDKSKKERLLSFSNLGDKYKNSRFEDLELGVEGQNDAIIWAKRFKNRIINKDQAKISLYMYGVTGNGKTELQACAYNELEKAGFNCLFTTLGKLFGSMYDYQNVKTLDVYNVLKSLDALFVDDFGSEDFDKKNKTWFFEIFDIVDKYNIPVFLTSNFSNPEMIVPFAKTEQAQSNEDLKIRRVVSRLIGKVDIVENYAKDFRWTQAIRRAEQRKSEELTEF